MATNKYAHPDTMWQNSSKSDGNKSKSTQKKIKSWTNTRKWKLSSTKHRDSKCFLRFFFCIVARSLICCVHRISVFCSGVSTTHIFYARTHIVPPLMKPGETADMPQNARAHILHIAPTTKQPSKPPIRPRTHPPPKTRHSISIRTFDIIRCFSFAFGFICAHIIIPPLSF